MEPMFYPQFDGRLNCRPGSLARGFGRVVLLTALCLIWGGSQAAAPDYSEFDAILLRNVQHGFVDYAGIDADPAFPRFLTTLNDTQAEDLEDSLTHRALLINAYNAFAIQGVLDGYTPSSWLGRYTYFKRRKYPLLGQPGTLHDLETRQLAAEGDPRIHFAIVCASISCPRLSSRAYVPAKLEEQLDFATRTFINDSSRNRYDVQRKIAFVSKIFDWYGKDFAGSAGSVQKYLSTYVSDPATAALLAADGFELRFIPWDWELNGTYPRQTGP
jgi:hypothetical protein